ELVRLEQGGLLAVGGSGGPSNRTPSVESSVTVTLAAHDTSLAVRVVELCVLREIAHPAKARAYPSSIGEELLVDVQHRQAIDLSRRGGEHLLGEFRLLGLLDLGTEIAQAQADVLEILLRGRDFQVLSRGGASGRRRWLLRFSPLQVDRGHGERDQIRKG